MEGISTSEPRLISMMWTGGDLNPGPRRCQRRDHSRLIYPPNPIPNKKAIKYYAKNIFKPEIPKVSLQKLEMGR